jgi:hypothetical protein
MVADRKPVSTISLEKTISVYAPATIPNLLEFSKRKRQAVTINVTTIIENLPKAVYITLLLNPRFNYPDAICPKRPLSTI